MGKALCLFTDCIKCFGAWAMSQTPVDELQSGPKDPLATITISLTLWSYLRFASEI